MHIQADRALIPAHSRAVRHLTITITAPSRQGPTRERPAVNVALVLDRWCFALVLNEPDQHRYDGREGRIPGRRGCSMANTRSGSVMSRRGMYASRA